MTDHLKAQAIRVARLFVVAFVAQLVTTGTANLGWKTLAALGTGDPAQARAEPADRRVATHAAAPTRRLARRVGAVMMLVRAVSTPTRRPC
ncbi:hypothetical protein KGQ19_41880 [Catenulispora sp. NL8]|uniref:Uncharacterized protein n=1 Tax=Catenulispora pinistramenti TaxID=2705254 RepID=A0ABS5L5K7_9ACTN|nr:hypothetical protein [Catenulispora pinistramenti]MBS2553424.1 hypothetical protein [Catenulispora pinistramenti]